MTTLVTIRECITGNTVVSSRHATDDLAEAQSQAIVKHFGKGKVFIVDRSLSTGEAQYGQIAHKVGKDFSTDTDRLVISFGA